jgi:hypothetical protein
MYLRLNISSKAFREYIHRKLKYPPVRNRDLLNPLIQIQLDGAETSAGSKTSDVGNGLGLSSLTAEGAEEAGVGTRESARVVELVNLANVAEAAGAGSVGRSIGAGEDLAGGTLLDSGLDVLEQVALGDDLGLVAGLEGVAGVALPVVVDGVENGVAGDLGGSARGLGDVVVLEGDHLWGVSGCSWSGLGEKTYVAGTSEVHGPVLVTVASSRPLAVTVNVRVGDGNSVVGVGSEDNVLTTDLGGSNVINPDEIGTIKSHGVATPNVLRVQFGDMDVLDDDVLGSLDVETLALDDTIGTDTNNGLVRVDNNRVKTSLIVGNINLGGLSLVVVAPVVLVDSSLAAGAGTPRGTTLLGGSSLSSGEVELLVEEDNTSGRVAKHRDQLIGRLGVGSLSVTTTGGLRGETLGGTCYASGRNIRNQRGNGHGKDRERLHIGREKKNVLVKNNKKRMNMEKAEWREM